MLQANQLRTSGKAQTTLLQDQPDKDAGDQIVSTQSLRTQKTMLSSSDE
jgi:hypothetical protein